MAITRNRSIAIVKEEINLKIKVGSVIKFSESQYDMSYTIQGTPDMSYTIQGTPWDREKPSKVGVILKVDQDFFDKYFRRFA
jgi:hypothetical protein